jgi:hypothetical protein
MSSRPEDADGSTGRVRDPVSSSHPDCTDTECLGGRSRAEMFALLGNEDRLAILDAVVRAHRRGDAPVAFSELRSAVGVRDSGRFSYHLAELTGPLLVREGDGYALAEAVREPLRDGVIEYSPEGR